MNDNMTAVWQAIQAIKDGWTTKLELEDGTVVYKVPASGHPNKYIVRVDFKVVQ